MKKYDKNEKFSFTQGAYPTIELIKKNPHIVKEIIYDDGFNEIEKLKALCKKNNIILRQSKKEVIRLSNRKNDYVIGVFEKHEKKLYDGNHIILENIENMGNLGTIIRTMAALDYRNLALIGKTCDYFNPKVIRASMGSFFDVNIERFDTIFDYKKKFQNEIYSFMLDDKAQKLSKIEKKKPFSLAFGNEGSGLTDEFRKFNTVKIEQRDLVDSMSIQIASAIGMYEFKEF
ncbi:MAG: TrmH family RNA methyltransferase [Tissierellia bacterium]|nr:TrmH family RNA methyltransferase [Tissierellia bacterium]